MRTQALSRWVLSRKAQGSVVVGACDGVQRIFKVTVLEIRGEEVKLAFDVDADVPVHRLEVWERIHSAAKPTSLVKTS